MLLYLVLTLISREILNNLFIQICRKTVNTAWNLFSWKLSIFINFDTDFVLFIKHQQTRINGSENVVHPLSLPSTRPNRRDLLLLPLFILHLATTVHGCVTLLTPRCLCWFSWLCALTGLAYMSNTLYAHTLCRQHRYIMTNMLTLLALQMFLCVFYEKIPGILGVDNSSIFG